MSTQVHNALGSLLSIHRNGITTDSDVFIVSNISWLIDVLALYVCKVFYAVLIVRTYNQRHVRYILLRKVHISGSPRQIY